MKRPCNENCNYCPLITHENGKMITKIMNEAFELFGSEFYRIVQNNCPNLTCCFNCYIDDFTHYKKCEFNSNIWKNKIDQWNEYYGCIKGDLLFIKRLKEKGFDKHQIYDILETIDETCNHCWDGKKGCQCYNDE